MPTSGGDTQYVNMHDAYDDLPEATKRKIDGLKAVHVYQSKYSPRSLGTINEESRRNLPPPGIHPLVRTHPENGRKAAIMLRFSWSIHVNTEPAGASFGAYRSNHIFRPEAPRRAAAGSETGLLFDFDDVPPNCFHVLANGAVVGRIMRVIQYRRRQVGVRSADAAARPAISGNGLPPCCRQSHRSRRHRGHRSRHRRPLPHSGQADAGSRPWQRRQRSSPHRSM